MGRASEASPRRGRGVGGASSRRERDVSTALHGRGVTAAWEGRGRGVWGVTAACEGRHCGVRGRQHGVGASPRRGRGVSAAWKGRFVLADDSFFLVLAEVLFLVAGVTVDSAEEHC